MAETNLPLRENDNSRSSDDVSGDATKQRPPIPKLYTTWPPLRDDLDTETSRAQNETVEECLPWLSVHDDKFPNADDLDAHGTPKLRRMKHVRFLQNSLKQLPRAFVSLDASRPWLLYWSLNSLSMLGFDDETMELLDYKARAISTLSSCRPSTDPHNGVGGYGGSSHQLPHLACTYAAVLTLCLLGGPTAYDSIDRRAIWLFLCRMKRADGGFTMCEGGEEDVRGAYCALVVAALLALPLELHPAERARLRGEGADGVEGLADGVGEWVGRCQTFEGGLGGAPGNEAHGAYGFCGLAALCLLGPPGRTVGRYLDAGALVGWLAARQHAPEGGFGGRTNKLVDGCYSHWVGGCWPLLEAALGTSPTLSSSPSSPSPASAPQQGVADASQNETGVGTSLWDREGLARYILCCAQNPPGGLRDKPGKGPDAYHTCYNLAGLSWARYRYGWGPRTHLGGVGAADAVVDGGEAGEGWKEEEEGEKGERQTLDAAFGWRVTGTEDSLPVDLESDVVPVHPVFVVRMDKVEEMRRYFEAKGAF